MVSLLALLLAAQVLLAKAVGDPPTVFIPSGMLTAHATKVQPHYPPEARQAHVEGTVLLRVRTSLDGTVSEVEPLAGPSLLMDAAQDAVRQWHYTAYYRAGRPVSFITMVSINFAFGRPDGSTSFQDDLVLPVSPEVMALHLRSGEDPSAKASPALGEGPVHLSITVDAEGNVESVQPLFGQPALVDLCRTVVSQWKYVPYQVSGEAPKRVRSTLTFLFESPRP